MEMTGIEKLEIISEERGAKWGRRSVQLKRKRRFWL